MTAPARTKTAARAAERRARLAEREANAAATTRQRAGSAEGTGRRRAEREAAAARIAERESAGRRRRSGAGSRESGGTKVTERARAGTVTAPAPVEAPPRTRPVREPSRAVPRPEERRRSKSVAARRALARRAHREGRLARPVDQDKDQDSTAGRASFVILIIALLTVGVAATLWLSTQAIADSYRLEKAKKDAGMLAEQAAELQRDVTKAESASELAKRAKEMGMVPAGDPARLVVRPDGHVVVVGEPTPAEKPKPPKPSTDQEPPAGDQPERQAGTTPGDG